MAHPSILIVGAKGRMGLAIRDTAIRLGFPIAGAVDAGEDPMQFIAQADVVVDFSHHTATAQVIEMVAAAGKALVIGTTGHSTADRAELATSAAKIPCVWAGNFSVGVNLLNHLVREAARALDSSFDIEVVEMHHRMKKDAPSGTVGTLLRILEESRGLSATDEKHGRSGITGERTSKEIGVHSLRGGDVVGDHTVVFAGAGERLELTHKASSREIFALGALRAAGWLVGRAPGLYEMSHVLGIGESGRQS